MEFETIGYEVAEGVLTITLNRPERLNAFTEAMGAELIEAFERADRDDEVRAIIVTGTGRGFCAGMDLGERRQHLRLRRGPGRRDPPRRRRPGGAADLRDDQAGDRGDQRPGGGGGDHDDAADGHPPGGRGRAHRFRLHAPGIVPEACSSWFLPRIVGISQAMEWVASGRVFTAAGGARRRSGAQRAPARASCSAWRASWRRRSPRTPRPCRWRSRGG